MRALGSAGVILAVSLAAVGLLSRVPFTEDVYYCYRNLAWCWYPLNRLDPISCMWDLAPLGWRYLPLRSYTYVGSLPSLVYLPMFLLWPSPHSVRLLGLLSLALQAFLIGRLCGYGTLKAFLVLLAFMPYSFMLMLDLGPSIYPLTGIFVAIFLIQRWIASFESRPRIVYPVLLGVLLFAQIWIKLSFVYCLPGIALFMLYYVRTHRPSLTSAAAQRRLFIHSIVLASVGGILSAALLTARGRPPAGERYYQCARGVVDEAIGELPYAYTPWRQFLYLSKYFTNPLQAAHFVYRIRETVTPSGVLLCAVTVLLLGYGIVRLRGRDRFIATGLLSFGMVFAALLANPAAFGMHHVVLAYPFALLAVFAVLSGRRGDRAVRLLLAAFIALNGYQFYRMRGLDYREWDKATPGHALVPSFSPLNERLNAYASRYAFVHVDWGTYSIKALYGPRDQCNIAAWPLDSDEGVQSVRDICRHTGRRPMFIRMRERSGTDLAFLQEQFPGIVPMRLDFDAGEWGIWYQPLPRSRRYTQRMGCACDCPLRHRRAGDDPPAAGAPGRATRMMRAHSRSIPPAFPRSAGHSAPAAAVRATGAGIGTIAAPHARGGGNGHRT